MADKLDHAWDALVHYGADVEEFDDLMPELAEDSCIDAQEIEEQERQWVEEMLAEEADEQNV